MLLRLGELVSPGLLPSLPTATAGRRDFAAPGHSHYGGKKGVGIEGGEGRAMEKRREEKDA